MIDFNIREKCIDLNNLMQALHIRLGIFERLELIDVGAVPNDAVADSLDDALAKTITNFSNVINALVDEVQEVT